ncbi:hypothetical protein OH460_07715 [Vibrio sp. Makdt]|uniref:hypothetical protein n=1 Tax=Vibrio sp. Makdt TaxID=2998828 RepID=UPI0022CDAE28|nr:hypothetical protein [Vibrio sp. Makdt]MDA0152183.1 hypothetical protein [Vibrio sp. Makdt]
MKAQQVQRDVKGMWLHPDLPHWGEGTSSVQVNDWLAKSGLTHHIVLMEGEYGEQWANGMLESCSAWEPETDVQGAFLVGIWETDDGVVAMFASPLKFEIPKQVHLDAWVAEYARLMITQCHYGLTSAIEMGMASLENVDYDITDYSPSEAVDQEIAAMRDCC